ncbi:MAG: LOG family protein [Alphaproteobacteria bacterium]|jgi:uncharacterized protein (TIGR00730 family)|nr:LOG family protein [Alphaproteobacteria bacterium]
MEIKKENNPNSREARLYRIINEYIQAKDKLEEQDIHNTIVMYGSARILSHEEAEKNLQLAQENLKTAEDKTVAEKFLKKAEHKLEIAEYYERARELAHKFATWSKNLPKKEKYYICSGGGPGIMEAANRGAFEAGEKSIGLNIDLPFEQSSNKYVSSDLDINFNYFFMRKFWFAYFAKAFIVFPGGFGTMDELFEMLTLEQTNKMGKKVPVVFFGKDFFDKVLNIELFEKYSLISEDDKNQFLITDSIEETFEYVTNRLFSME